MDSAKRVASVLYAAWKGKSHCWLAPADRDKAACDLNDDDLIKWSRWALASMARFYENDAKRRERGLQEVVVMHGVIALALLTLRANTTRASFEVDGITFDGEPKGDWRVTIEQIDTASLRARAAMENNHD